MTRAARPAGRYTAAKPAGDATPAGDGKVIDAGDRFAARRREAQQPQRPTHVLRKGYCPIPGCDKPGRPYLCGWRCDRHRPGADRISSTPPSPVSAVATAPTPDPVVTEVRPASGPPAKGRRYNPNTKHHKWTKLREHLKQCDFCGMKVLNQTEDGRTWWQDWRWGDGEIHTNKGAGHSRVAECPGSPPNQ